MENLMEAEKSLNSIITNLEVIYLELDNLKIDLESEEEMYSSRRETLEIIKGELVKSIGQAILGGAIPDDSRVYEDFVKHPYIADLEGTVRRVLKGKLYEYNMLPKETTVGELIDKLKSYDRSAVVQVNGQKFVVNDLAIGKPIIDLQTTEA